MTAPANLLIESQPNTHLYLVFSPLTVIEEAQHEAHEMLARTPEFNNFARSHFTISIPTQLRLNLRVGWVTNSWAFYASKSRRMALYVQPDPGVAKKMIVVVPGIGWLPPNDPKAFTAYDSIAGEIALAYQFVTGHLLPVDSHLLVRPILTQPQVTAYEIDIDVRDPISRMESIVDYNDHGVYLE